MPIKTHTVVASDWWDQLSPEQKKDYIKKRPNSKYAQPAGKKAVTPTAPDRPAPPKTRK